MTRAAPIRAFLAVPLSDEVRDRYTTLHAERVRCFRGLRWVKPENVHVTMRFLGDVEEAAIEPLRHEVGRAVAGLPAFRIVLGPPACFGRRSAPRTLWFGLSDGAAEMAALAGRVEAAVQKLGFAPDDKPWTAHVTVARNPKNQRAGGWGEALAASGLPGLGVEVAGVDLMASELLPGGPAYTRVWTARLAV